MTRILFGRRAPVTETVIGLKFEKTQGSSVMAEPYIEVCADVSDFHIRDHRLAATDRGPHRVPEHKVNASAAVFHLAVPSERADEMSF